MVILNGENQICGAMEYFDETRHSPLAAEVNALIHGMRLLQRMQFTRATLINMINGDIEISTDVFHWILQI